MQDALEISVYFVKNTKKFNNFCGHSDFPQSIVLWRNILQLLGKN